MKVLRLTTGRRRAVALVLGVACAIAVAGASLAAQGGAAAETRATATCTPKGTLDYGISGAGITQLDPTSLAFSGQLPLQTLLYDSLTVFNSKGRLVNDLATKWKASKDLKTYWFWIRHDVKYANGRPFTSSDVVANVLHNLDLSVPSQWRPPIADIRSTRSIGKYEVRFKLGHPSIDLPAALAQI